MALIPWTVRATPDLDQLIERIKQPAPSTIAFTEVRFSRLLKQPLIVSGQMGYLGPGNLDRNVEHPYREHTEIRNDSVRVLREGESDRSFALNRAPELSALLLTYSSLLSGDRVAVERAFRLQADGDSAQWTLELTPVDARIQRRLKQVSIIGKDEMPQCFAIYTGDGGVSIMLLGAIATKDLSPTITEVALLQSCRIGS